MDHPNQGGDKDGQFPWLLAQDGEISIEMLKSLLGLDDVPYSIGDAAGTVQNGAPTGSLEELNSLNFHNLQAWNFGNQSVAGTEQPAPGAPKFAYNENQTLSSHDKELNEQQCDQLIADTLGLLQPPTMPLGPPDASYSIGQFSPWPAFRTQLPENQMPPEIQPLIQEQLHPAAKKELKKRLRKRECDRDYRQRKKAIEQKKEQELTNRNQELQNANQVKDQLLNGLRIQNQILEDQLQRGKQLQEEYTKVEAEKEHWKKKYLLLIKRSKNNQQRQKLRAMRKQLCLYQKNLGKLCLRKAKKKLKKQIMMVETAEETESDN